MDEAKIRTERRKLFLRLDEEVFKIYKTEKLTHLDEASVSGKGLTSWFHEVIDKKNKIHDFNSVDFIFDLSFISKDIKYLTGLMYYLAPNINICSLENYTYFQNTFDKRYLMFASLINQSLYNYWDRIGDLLYCYFETGLTEGNIYFSKVLNNFPAEYKVDKNYNELFSIYESDIKPLLNKRHQIVHFKQLETRYFLDSMRNFQDKENLSKLEQEKINLPNFYKHHIGMSIKGLIVALNLINQLQDK